MRLVQEMFQHYFRKPVSKSYQEIILHGTEEEQRELTLEMVEGANQKQRELDKKYLQQMKKKSV